jgi:ATP-dependent protease ClpP protease subunit
MAMGTVMEMKTSLQFTEMLEEKINSYLRKNTRMTEDEIQRPKRTNLDVWYNAQQALEIGVVDKVVNL